MDSWLIDQAIYTSDRENANIYLDHIYSNLHLSSWKTPIRNSNFSNESLCINMYHY
jgi:hypothetical protein